MTFSVQKVWIPQMKLVNSFHFPACKSHGWPRLRGDVHAGVVFGGGLSDRSGGSTRWRERRDEGQENMGRRGHEWLLEGRLCCCECCLMNCKIHTYTQLSAGLSDAIKDTFSILRNRSGTVCALTTSIHGLCIQLVNKLHINQSLPNDFICCSKCSVLLHNFIITRAEHESC